MQRSIIVLRNDRRGWSFVKGVSWGDGSDIKRLHVVSSREDAVTFLAETANMVVNQANKSGYYAFAIPLHGALPTSEDFQRMYDARRPQREEAERHLNQLMKTIAPLLDKMWDLYSGSEDFHLNIYSLEKPR